MTTTATTKKLENECMYVEKKTESLFSNRERKREMVQLKCKRKRRKVKWSTTTTTVTPTAAAIPWLRKSQASEHLQDETETTVREWDGDGDDGDDGED